MHTLNVSTRPARKANALRRQGIVPGVVYGPSIESTPIAIARKDLRALFAKITRSSRITLSIAGEKKPREMDVFVKVIDYDPVTDEPVHVDFYHPDTKHPLKLNVPVKIVGEAIGKKSGGVLNVQFNDIPVHGMPKDIPHLITIDVSALDLGEAIHIADLDFGNVEPMLPPERVVVMVIAPRGLGVAEEGEAEGEAIEEGAEEGATAGEGEAEAEE
jgi:large subunit ribosomal protein L25